jgi:hypothetical protein
MIRLLIVCITGITLIFIVCVGAIRAQTFNGSTVRNVLDSPGCPPDPLPVGYAARSCWLGIVIDVTTRPEALAILTTHPWIAQVYENESVIVWDWSGEQPAAIDSRQGGVLRTSHNGIVRQIRILTTIPFGEIWAALGAPDTALLVRPVSRSSSYQIGIYQDEHAQAISSVGCPAEPVSFWFSKTTLGRGELWSTEYINGIQFNIYDSPAWWVNLRVCRP